MNSQAKTAVKRPAENQSHDTRAEWDAIAAAYDRTNTPTQMWLGNEGLRRAGLRAGMRFLDVAAGSGALSIPAARLGARVLGVDQSPAMLDRLLHRARTEGLDIETRVMDGHALELKDASFDIVGSQFGVMLFPDMPRGVREMVRVVKPGGRVLMNVYGDPHRIEFLDFFIRAIQTVRATFTGPPMEPPPLPFQLQDPSTLRAVMVSAGLSDVTVETILEPTQYRTGKELWDWLLGSNPIVEAVLAELSLSSDERHAIERALDGFVRERARDAAAAVLTSPINIGVGTK
jgi:ubiquinone/menaquinone biosynthesis C-methylase UbiE